MPNTSPHHRRSIRLRDYDYTQNGAYFVTLCTHERVCLFGKVVGDAVAVNAWGAIVQAEWARTAVLRPQVELDAFVVMPNHVHGIIVIFGDEKVVDGRRGMMHSAANAKKSVGATRRVAPTRPNGPPSNSLGAIIGQFKSVVTKRIRQLADENDAVQVWQRNYYEHIIRSEASLDDFRAYIANNPARWREDSMFVG